MKKLKYAVEQRLRFIDFLVDHYGSINRAALTDYFGISVPQASADIADYLELAPVNMMYNPILRSYVKGLEFKRVWA